jgi:ABC-type transport system involved in multi-copper enzyme maturation permease subunit
MMRNVVKCAMLDARTIRSYLKNMVFMLGLGVVLSLVMKSPTLVMTYMVVILMMVSTYPFAVSESNQMAPLYGSLPMKRWHLVAGRYLYALVMGILATAFSMVMMPLVTRLIASPDAGDGTPFALLLLGLFLLVCALQYPIFFGLDYTKSKTFGMLPALVVFLGITLLPGLNKTLHLVDTHSLLSGDGAGGLWGLLLGFAAAVLVFYALSAYLSFRLYNRRDL